MPKIAKELIPVLRQLHAEGFEVWTYQPNYGEIASLFWFENGRVLNIQPNSWRNEKYARDRYNIGVSYIPSRQFGSGCALSQDDMGTPALHLLAYRAYPTWVKGPQNYPSMAAYLKEHKIMDYFKLEAV